MKPHKKKYFLELCKFYNGWYWDIVTVNGQSIIGENPVKIYKNKAQCRNVGKKFALYCGLEWRE